MKVICNGKKFKKADCVDFGDYIDQRLLKFSKETPMPRRWLDIQMLSS